MAELVAVDDFLSKVLWVRSFMEEQGIDLESNVFQDNQSCILMCKKGREILSKRTRAMNVRYFAVKDSVDKGFLKIMHLGTQQMLGNFFTKPLQGAKFRDFQKLILGEIGSADTAESVGTY